MNAFKPQNVVSLHLYEALIKKNIGFENNEFQKNEYPIPKNILCRYIPYITMVQPAIKGAAGALWNFIF